MQIWSMCDECGGYDCEHQRAKQVDKPQREPRESKPKAAKTVVAVETAPVGLRPDEVLRDEQSGRCKLCLNPIPVPQTCSFDYDPKTMKPRGVLCVPCKGALQGFRQNVAVMARAIRYVETCGESTDG